MTNPTVKVGLMSGLNYGNPGCREGLWQLAAEVFTKEQVNFIVLAGGLVDGKALKEIAREEGTGLKGIEKAQKESEFLESVACHLATQLPVIEGVKIYIITSPAYDGEFGDLVAQRLVELREDIRLYEQGSDVFIIKLFNLTLGVYTPEKGPFMRADYYDSPALRILKDKKMSGNSGLRDINVVGLVASSILNPGDSTDIQRPYLTLPVLHKIDEMKTAENQVGIRILQFNSSNAQEAIVTTYSFKDLVANEWVFIKLPKSCSRLQKTIISNLKKRGSLTAGQLADFTDYKTETILAALEELLQIPPNRTWPGLFFHEASRRYSFKTDWFQEKLRYQLPEEQQQEESYLAFSCLHAACRHTDMEFFCEGVPRLILDNDIKTLVGTGDFIEGLEHNLVESGEVYCSRHFPPNYDWQEALSAYMLGTVICKVFDERIKQKVTAKTTEQALERALFSSLLSFLFIPGNHCEWTIKKSFSALSIFSRFLEKFVIEHIEKTLSEIGIADSHNLVKKVVGQKLIRLRENEKIQSPSELFVSLNHPKMGRAKTTSIRLQGMLAKARECQIVFGGNFHTAESLEEWDPIQGQRVCVQLGTLKVESKFETGKLKEVDFGVAMLKVVSARMSLSGLTGISSSRKCSRRIQRTQTAFWGVKRPTLALQEGNHKILDQFEQYLRENEPSFWLV